MMDKWRLGELCGELQSCLCSRKGGEFQLVMMLVLQEEKISASDMM